MSDATLCDRCGEVFAADAALRLVTDGQVGGTMMTTTKHPNSDRRAGGADPVVTGHVGRNDGVTTHEPNWDDLCEDCAESLREWWEVEQ